MCTLIRSEPNALGLARVTQVGLVKDVAFRAIGGLCRHWASRTTSYRRDCPALALVLAASLSLSRSLCNNGKRDHIGITSSLLVP